jgi:hypothetical protein
MVGWNRVTDRVQLGLWETVQDVNVRGSLAGDGVVSDIGIEGNG